HNSLVIGLSDTGDPSGTWHEFRFNLFENSTFQFADFPTLGFNKNWITISINMFNSSFNLSGVTIVAIYYPDLRSGTMNAFRFDLIDAQVRTPPVYRGGDIWYAQTIGLPSSSYTHTAAQWTRIGTPSGAFVDGGRIEDPSANSTNGGKWYSHPSIAVNAQLNF